MQKDTLSYCTVKSINLSERSKWLLARINHTERRIKIQGGTVKVKEASSSPSFFLLTESLKLLTFVPITPKNALQRAVFRGGGSLAHTVNQGVIFDVGAWIYIFPVAVPRV